MSHTSRGSGSAGPVVSVVVAVYNAERHLRECIDSVLAQSFSGFELIALDDASTDGSAGILDSYSDPRVVPLRNPSNLGLTRSLNRALGATRGRYIARLDADDLMEPERITKQVAYLDAHPGTGVVGTWTTEIDESGTPVGAHQVCPHPGFLRWEMTHRNPVYHPTAMMRREAVQSVGGYDPAMRYAQDHDLWIRMLMAGWKVEVLPERLTRYRRSPEQISSSRRDEQVRFGWGVRQRYAEWLLGEPVPLEEVDGMMRLLGWGDWRMNEEAGRSIRLIQRLRHVCRQDCDAVGRGRIDDSLRGLLLGRAAESAREDPGFSLALTRFVLRMSPGSLMDGRLWEHLIRLGLCAWRR